MLLLDYYIVALLLPYRYSNPYLFYPLLHHYLLHHYAINLSCSCREETIVNYFLLEAVVAADVVAGAGVVVGLLV